MAGVSTESSETSQGLPDWREEYKLMKCLNKRQMELLDRGPDSLSASWILMAMHNDWKRMKGIKEPEPPDCQSSLKEWEESIKKYQND